MLWAIAGSCAGYYDDYPKNCYEQGPKIINSPLQADMARGQDYLKFKCSKENQNDHSNDDLVQRSLVKLFYTEILLGFLESKCSKCDLNTNEYCTSCTQ